MAFLRSVSSAEVGPSLTGEGVLLRAPQFSDFAEWAALREESRAFLAPWEPIWPSDDLTRMSFRRRIRRYRNEIRDDQAYPFFIFRMSGNILVGGLTLSNVTRGMTQSATIGYWMGEPFAGKGHMSAALRAIIPYAFGPLRLHRLEAACLPHNRASITLLERCGFQREGLARGLVCIAGRWQDHIRFARLAED
ncbi:ribosomal-protein-alanine N-acetyltransferase [Rhodopseudomonas julia]|uniref:Ribosomal-protein-alanine N-acetyltransferase n=1 Tax=Rhodopseudomonas julia TaxID=200617 RepID=A0ABU0C2W1_9BRAD|nr:GNAT family protein [Rhodopseudomonas julia]MDQ0324820.1 ribosomal-protein-alanine N-acetyltransferase [Rhodopseudomonas julia]